MKLILDPLPELRGKHAFMAPSQYYWLYDNREKFIARYDNSDAQLRGTLDHEFAELCIKRKQKLPKSKSTLNQYVNDAIAYDMVPEVALRYSDICFGHADCLTFDERKKLLRIHDLKTGNTPAKFDQLEIYAALFYSQYWDQIEYSLMIPIKECRTELRIYQFDDVQIEELPMDDVIDIQNRIQERHEWLSEELTRRGK